MIIKLKRKELSKQDFITTYVRLVTDLDRKSVQVLSLLIYNYPNTLIDSETKHSIKSLLNVSNKKESYQNQMVSKMLTKLSQAKYIVKIQNGMYELNSTFREFAKYISALKENETIELNFNFLINEL